MLTSNRANFGRRIKYIAFYHFFGGEKTIKMAYGTGTSICNYTGPLDLQNTSKSQPHIIFHGASNRLPIASIIPSHAPTPTNIDA